MRYCAFISNPIVIISILFAGFINLKYIHFAFGMKRIFYSIHRHHENLIIFQFLIHLFLLDLFFFLSIFFFWRYLHAHNNHLMNSKQPKFKINEKSKKTFLLEKWKPKQMPQNVKPKKKNKNVQNIRPI